MRDCLHDEQSKVALDEYLSQEAVDMLFQKFMGRYRPAIAAVVCQLEMTSKRKDAMKRSNAHYAQYLLSYCLSVYRKGLSNPVTLVHGRRLSRMQRTGWYLGRIGTSKAVQQESTDYRSHLTCDSAPRDINRRRIAFSKDQSFTPLFVAW